MPYVEPVYNIKCNLYQGLGFGGVKISDVGDLIEADIPCNFAWGKRVQGPTTGGTSSIGIPVSLMTALIPSSFSKPLGPTDLPFGPGFVFVQAPVLCWYWVWMWDYIGAGFDNEHVGILCLKCHP